MNAFRFLIGLLYASAAAASHHLPHFGELPKLESQWQLRERGTNGPGGSWLILTNRVNGQTLSFAARLQQPGDETELVYLSDTAGEIFAHGGLWGYSTLPRATYNIWMIRNRVVKIGSTDGLEGKHYMEPALEYTLVLENEREQINHLAHGYATRLGDVVLFVQHTSLTPITPDLAKMTASDAVYLHGKRQTPPRPAPKESRE